MSDDFWTEFWEVDPAVQKRKAAERLLDAANRAEAAAKAYLKDETRDNLIAMRSVAREVKERKAELAEWTTGYDEH